MTSRPSTAARSIFALGLFGAALLAQTGIAEANGGFFEGLARIFAPPPEPRYEPRSLQPVYVPQVRVSRPRRTVRARHASLPRVEKAKADETVKGKPIVREPDKDPVSSLMNDPTLRRGDIVVLASGVKVFKGDASAPHRPNDFEDVRSSKLLGDKMRRTLAAMRMQPAAPQLQAEKKEPASGERTEQAKIHEERVAVTGSLPRKVGP